MTGASIPLALTMGDPAGIGGEIALMAWQRRGEGLPPFFVIDDPARLRRLAAQGGRDVPVAELAGPEGAAAAFGTALPVLPVGASVAATPGRPDPSHAAAVVAAIDRAVALVQAGRAGAVVTNPIHKAALYQAGFPDPGHTEYLARRAGLATAPVMMLAIPGLRVVPVTIHVALAEAIRLLDTPRIVHAARVTAAALRDDFGIDRPRLALAGLNPHAGEGGHLGREDIEIVAPAVAALKGEGIAATGPLPPDTMFSAAARAGYDAAICMYHDQALIPLKALDFDRGVNATLGLPFVRTSPDHGTAFDIAGQFRASPESLIEALRMAAAMAAHRAAAAAPVA